jgi:hypothetical protein
MEKFKYRQDLPPECNIRRLERHIVQASNPTVTHLRNWLGEETEIKGRADARNMIFTITFNHRCLGALGQVDLVFEGERAMPSDVSVRIRLSDAPGEPAGVDERIVMMRKIYNKAVKQFVMKLRWRILYYSGEELLESRIVIDDRITSVKGLAYHNSPPGTDMIKLIPPKGQGGTLIRTAKKRWARED